LSTGVLDKKKRLQPELHPIHISVSKHNPVNFSKYSSRRKKLIF